MSLSHQRVSKKKTDPESDVQHPESGTHRVDDERRGARVAQDTEAVEEGEAEQDDREGQHGDDDG